MCCRQCSVERAAETPKVGQKPCSCESVAGLRLATPSQKHGQCCVPRVVLDILERQRATTTCLKYGFQTWEKVG